MTHKPAWRDEVIVSGFRIDGVPLKTLAKGGRGSGNFGHAGRPGNVGGSSAGGRGGGIRFSYADRSGMTAYGEKLFSQYNFSDTQIEALKKYKGDSYDFNTRLRGGGSGGTLAGAIQEIDNVLGNSALPDDVVVFRGVDPDWVPEVGNTFLDKGFVSTTFSERGAFGWSAGVIDVGEERPALMEIRLPAGSQGVYLDVPDIEYRGEFELLLPRNQWFSVTSKYQTQFGEEITDVFVVEIVNEK